MTLTIELQSEPECQCETDIHAEEKKSQVDASDGGHPQAFFLSVINQSGILFSQWTLSTERENGPDRAKEIRGDGCVVVISFIHVSLYLHQEGHC